MQGRCCQPQAQVFQPQQCSAKGFGGDGAGGEHGASATAASVPRSVQMLHLSDLLLVVFP